MILLSRGAAKECSRGRRPWFPKADMNEPRSGERFCRPLRGSCLCRAFSTAFGRGYILSPLRGFTTECTHLSSQRN
jgi:hypothetical protein